MLGRLRARLREAYEAELVHAATGYRGAVRVGVDPHARDVRSFELVALDTRTGETRTVLRAPRLLPFGGALLHPALLQVGLPVSAIALAARLARRWWLAGGVGPLRSSDAVWMLVALGVASLLGRSWGEPRWRRLREAAWDRWAWRREAAAASLREGEVDVAADPATQVRRLMLGR